MKKVDTYDHEALNAERLKRAWSITRLSKASGINHQGIVRALEGRAGIDLVYRVCRALGTDHVELYKGPGGSS